MRAKLLQTLFISRDSARLSSSDVLIVICQKVTGNGHERRTLDKPSKLSTVPKCVRNNALSGHDLTSAKAEEELSGYAEWLTELHWMRDARNAVARVASRPGLELNSEISTLKVNSLKGGDRRSE